MSLIEDFRVAANPALIAAVKSRIQALECWSAKLEVQRLRATSDMTGLLQAAVKKAPVRAELMNLARGKIAHWRGAESLSLSNEG
jgi:hypothetical protein